MANPSEPYRCHICGSRTADMQGTDDGWQCIDEEACKGRLRALTKDPERRVVVVAKPPAEKSEEHQRAAAILERKSARTGETTLDEVLRCYIGKRVSFIFQFIGGVGPQGPMFIPLAATGILVAILDDHYAITGPKGDFVFVTKKEVRQIDT